MNDFILSITKNSSGFVITTASGEQVPLALSSPTRLSGTRLYQLIFTGPILLKYQEQIPDRLLLYLPPELFDWPWQTLHDSSQPLALRHPIVLLPLERLKKPMPDPRLKPSRLRILLTLALDEEHAALGAAIKQMVEAFEQRHAGQVLVSRESHKLDVLRLLHVFQSTSQRFHIWHHVGPCSPDFALKLADAAPKAYDLNNLLALQEDIRCFVLSTCQPAPAASALSELHVPFLLCQSTRSSAPADLSLLQGFYDRLLTHDLAVASTLGRLEQYLAADAAMSAGWSELTLVAQTPKLYLGIPQPAPTTKQIQAPATPVRMLVLKANPPYDMQAQELLRIEREIREIKSAISENRRFFDLSEEGSVRRQDFSRHLLRHRPMLLHFSGHADSGDLIFEKYASSEELQAGTSHSARSGSEPDPVPFSTIAGILAEYQKTLRCVVLNACETEQLAEVICEQIDCAIGMRGAINDGLAIRFSELFYRALAYGESVGQAFRKARKEIALLYHPGQAEHFQLKSKPGVNPDELFFVQSEGGSR
jgi:CHAT domain-containing protein